jgi:hypothetical protein
LSGRAGAVQHHFRQGLEVAQQFEAGANVSPSEGNPQMANPQLPEHVERRLKTWLFYYKIANRMHYLVGIIGVGASSLGGALGQPYSPYLAAIAALCLAVLGFVQPDRKYLKFVRAWRILDVAAGRYQAGLISIEQLYDALERGEQAIGAIEQDHPPQREESSNVHNRSPQPQGTSPESSVRASAGPA